jgi:Kef-type K+ transport system membrane component KefB
MKTLSCIIVAIIFMIFVAIVGAWAIVSVTRWVEKHQDENL